MHNLAKRESMDIPCAPLPADALPPKVFEQIAHLVSAHTGIRLPAAKKQMVEGRLRKRARALGCADVESYCQFLLEQNGLNDEFQHVVDAITTNKTDFYREPDHFEFLVRRAIPDLVRNRRRAGSLMKIWSAACSNGAEPYTVAMVLSDLADCPKFAILATDICTEVLEAGRRAVYSEEMLRPIPPDQHRRYLLRGRSASEFRIVPELRRVVRFEQLNLMDGEYPVDRDVDVVFLRNVLIYFDKPTQTGVLRRLLNHLRKGGFLFLGHSESMVASELGVNEIGSAVFQKR
jgi:chemotaxis protein methyltransferase CheR